MSTIEYFSKSIPYKESNASQYSSQTQTQHVQKYYNTTNHDNRTSFPHPSYEEQQPAQPQQQYPHPQNFVHNQWQLPVKSSVMNVNEYTPNQPTQLVETIQNNQSTIVQNKEQKSIPPQSNSFIDPNLPPSNKVDPNWSQSSLFQCNLCPDKEFFTLHEFGMHLRSKKHTRKAHDWTTDLFYCVACKRPFRNLADLTLHCDTDLDHKQKASVFHFITCNDCNRSFSSLELYRVHLESDKHKAKVESMMFNTILKTNNEIQKIPRKDNEDPFTHFCDVCNMRFLGHIPFGMHVKSHGHFRRLQQLRLVPFTDERVAQEKSIPPLSSNSEYYCSICKVQCPGAPQYEQHLVGKKHRLKLGAKQPTPPVNNSTTTTPKEATILPQPSSINPSPQQPSVSSSPSVVITTPQVSWGLSTIPMLDLNDDLDPEKPLVYICLEPNQSTTNNGNDKNQMKYDNKCAICRKHFKDIISHNASQKHINKVKKREMQQMLQEQLFKKQKTDQ